MYRMVIVLCLSLFIFCCAKNKIIDSTNTSLNFGTNETLDIITWNIQDFTKHNSTLNYLLELIPIMDPDIIALQEIANEDEFNTLKNGLDNYNGIITNSASYNINLAFLYSNNLEIDSSYEIFKDDWRSFPRPPLIIKIILSEQDVYIINNHFKCCGDGTLDMNDEYDEENRRYNAVNFLKEYIDTYLSDENVIVLGDLNDELQEDSSDNVFQNFINDSTNYMFVDMSIAYGSSSNFSWPGWHKSTYDPAHFDHILITNELFDEFANPRSTVQTINIENYFEGGWSDYEKYVSDHRPVVLSLNFNP